MAATIIGVIGVVLIALGSLCAAMTIVLVHNDPSSISAAKDYVLIAATSVGTLGGFLTGYVKGRSDGVESPDPAPTSPPVNFQSTTTIVEEEK